MNHILWNIHILESWIVLNFNESWIYMSTVNKYNKYYKYAYCSSYSFLKNESSNCFCLLFTVFVAPQFAPEHIWLDLDLPQGIKKKQKLKTIRKRAATSHQTCSWAGDYCRGARIPVQWSKPYKNFKPLARLHARGRGGGETGGWTCLSRVSSASATWADQRHTLTCGLPTTVKSIKALTTWNRGDENSGQGRGWGVGLQGERV